MKVESPQTPLSVSALTEAIRRQLEETYDWVQVQGEISGLKRAPSGHAYFRLKDSDAVLECVAWKTTVVRWAGLDLQDGDEVVAGGKVTVYPPRGQYQFVVTAIRRAGLGALQQRFEALKRRLADEGLFDPVRKRPLPSFPRKIAVITSPTGAAVYDFLRIIRQGACPVDCVVCPVLVQGAEASGEIADMIRSTNEIGGFDLIVLCRGGGSLEDLWAFNEEIVARVIVASKIPVISAIGHEIDFTIADFTADMRAPTPTAAGQLVCGLFNEHRRHLSMHRDRLHRAFLPALQRERDRLEVTRKALRRYHPITTLAEWRQRLDDLTDALVRSMMAVVQQGRMDCEHGLQVLGRSVIHELDRRRQTLRSCEHLLHSYNPLRNLSRGYSLCKREDGRLVRNLSDVEPRDVIRVIVSDGTFGAAVLPKEDWP